MKKAITFIVSLVILVGLLPVHKASALIDQKDDTNRFLVELASDPFLLSLLELRDLGNSIDPQSKTEVGEYLKNSDWYNYELGLIGNNTNLINKFDGALRHLNNLSNRVPGQKIQCVGFVSLIAGMDERFYEISGQPIEIAKDLIPSEIKSGLWADISVRGYRTLVIKKIEQVNIGDLFVTYSTRTGHVFAVVSKKMIDGKTVLLVISANYFKDGRIHLFEVDETNFDEVFGAYPYRKIVIRNN